MYTSGHSQNHETHHGTELPHLLTAVFYITYAASMAVETMAHDWEFDRFDDGSQSKYSVQTWRATINQRCSTFRC